MNTPTQKGIVFQVYVKSVLEAAAAAFAQDPSANNWQDLKIAMWAWQHVHQQGSLLNAAAHENLCRIAEHAKGDRNFGEDGNGTSF